MSESSGSTRAKLFTVEEANAMLPLVRAIAQDAAQLAQSIVERRERLALLLGERGRRADVYSDELTQIEQQVDQDVDQLREYAQELHDLGVELKNAPEGLLDFPSIMDGRIVYLCWKLGENEVLHWHELDAGFAGRQTLVAGSALGDDPSDSQQA